jgi:hypothetical protein
VSLVPDLLGKIQVERLRGGAIYVTVVDGRPVHELDVSRQPHAPLAPAPAGRVREVSHGHGVCRVLVRIFRVLLEWVVRFAESALAGFLEAVFLSGGLFLSFAFSFCMLILALVVLSRLAVLNSCRR